MVTLLIIYIEVTIFLIRYLINFRYWYDMADYIKQYKGVMQIAKEATIVYTKWCHRLLSISNNGLDSDVYQMKCQIKEHNEWLEKVYICLCVITYVAPYQ